MQADLNAFAARAIAYTATANRPASGINIKTGTYHIAFKATATGTLSSSAAIIFNAYAGGTIEDADADHAESTSFFTAHASGHAVDGNASTGWLYWYLDTASYSLPVYGTTSYENNNGVLDAYADSSPITAP